MKLIIGLLIIVVVGFVLWLLFRKGNPTLAALKKEEKVAQSKVKKAIKHDKIVAAKHAKITKEVLKIKKATSDAHDTRATKMSRLIKKKNGR